MWKNREGVQAVSKGASWCAVVLAFLSGVAGICTLVAAPSGIASSLAVGFAFLSALAGILALLAGRQKEKLEEAFKRTPPDIDVGIKTGEEDQEFYVVVEPQNRVPFEFQWLVVTGNNQVISGLQLDWEKIFPDEQYKPMLQRARINLAKVIDDYIELRFHYRSIYADEVGDPKLCGRLIKRYNLSQDKKYCLPLE